MNRHSMHIRMGYLCQAIENVADEKEMKNIKFFLYL